MSDSRKPPRAGRVPPPVPGAVPPPPPQPRAAQGGEGPSSVPIDLGFDRGSGSISLAMEDTPLPMPVPAVSHASDSTTVGPIASMVPPPPPRPRRLTPPPPPQPRRSHRIGVDPTLPLSLRGQPQTPTPTPRDEPVPSAVPASSLFHQHVVHDPMPARPIQVARSLIHKTQGETRWSEELKALEREIAALRPREPARAALYLESQALILLGTQGERVAATAALDEALALADDRPALYLARREALLSRELARATELGRRELERVVDPKERVALLLHLGALEEQAGDRAAAQRAFDAARELDPRHATPLFALAELHLDEQAGDKLAAVYHALAEASLDPVSRSMFRTAAGSVEERNLNQLAAARDTYRVAIGEDPTNLLAITALSSLALRTEQWGDLARALEAEADQVSDLPTERRLYERAGDLYWERLSDAEAATTAYRKAALAAPEAVAPLRRLAAVLESIGRWNELCDVLVAELPLCRTPDERAELHHLLGEVKENHLERPDDALSSYEAALGEVPDHVPSLQALTGLFARTRRLDALMRAEQGEAERLADPARRASRYLHLGDLAAHVVGDEAEAARLYERCAELEPGHRAAFQGLEAIARRRGDHARLAALYEQQAEHTRSPALRRLYLVAAARALLDADRSADRPSLQPSFLPRVERHLRAASVLEAPDLTPLATLADALEDAGQWEALVEALTKLGECLEEPADQIGLLHRAARILELRLGADARALALYEQMLVHEPTHEAALLAVVRLHQRAGRSALEIEALGRLRDRATTDSEGAMLSYRMGRIHERRLGDTDAALRAYEESLARRPDFAPARRALERLLRRDRRWQRLVEILERQLTGATDPAARAELRYAIGQIEELHLRNLARAEEAYAGALADRPDDEATAAALAQVREARGDATGLRRFLEERPPRAEDESTVVAHLCRLAALVEGPLEDPGRAAELYAQAVATGPLGVRAHVALLRAHRRHTGVQAATEQLRALASALPDAHLAAGARLLVALRRELFGVEPGAFDELGASREPAALDGRIRAALIPRPGTALDEQSLAELLFERSSTVDSPALRALLALESACRFDRLGQPLGAARALKAAEQAVNDLLPVLRGVRRNALQHDQLDSVITLYMREAELARDPANQAEALLCAGELAQGRAADARLALTCFRRLLQLQPLHPTAYEHAAQLLERAKDWPGLAALYRQRAEASTDPRVRGDAYLRKAEVERDRLRDVPSALSSLRAAIEARPDDLESHRAIAPLLEHQRFWQDAIETYNKIAELSRGDALARAAKVRAADLRERELGDREGARTILTELVADPEDRDATQRLAELSERMGRSDEAKALWNQLAQSHDPFERASALVSLGHVLETGERDAEGALARYEEALAVALANPEIAARLEARFRDAHALPVYTTAVERALRGAGEDGTGELELRLSLARVYLDDLGQPEAADAQLARCAEIAPDDAATFRELGLLYVDAGRPEEALPLLHRACALEPSSPDNLRALGEGLAVSGFRDATHLLETAAAFVEGAAAPPIAGPLSVRSPLTADEWATYFPRESGPGKVALSELARTIDGHAAAILAEVAGDRPRGRPLTAGQPETIVHATFTALGIPSLRVFVDPDLGAEARLCADETLAVTIGPALLEPGQAARLSFCLARLGAWIAQGETLGAFLRGRPLAAFVQAACDEGGEDEVREMRRRLGRVLPRKLRKDLERFAIPLADSVGVAGAWERSGYAAAEELALLVCRDVGVVFESLGYLPGETLPPRGRGVEVVRFLASEDCWRAYRRLTDG